MKDVTFGVKMPKDLRDQLNEMMKDSGLVGREFMQQLVDSYLLDQDKDSVPEMSEEIKELQALTHRINEMYLYLGTRFKNISHLSEKEKQDMNQIVLENEKKCEEKIKKYKEEAHLVKGQLDTFKVSYKELEDSKRDIEQKLNKVNDYNESCKELNNQYKQTIQNLTEKLDSLNPLEDENKQLLVTNQKLQENSDNMASDLWFLKRENEKLNELLIKQKEENVQGINQLKNQYNLEKQAALLEMQLKNQKQIESLHQKMTLMQEDHNNKLRDLILQAEDKAKNDKGKEKGE